MTHRILLVEDDRAILRGLGDNLRAESYGADDFVTKAFLLGELLARVRGLLRQRRESDAERDRFRRDVRSAAEVQQQLLPQSKPIATTIDLSGACIPALGIGGDYVDFIEIGPHLLGVVLADVAGKGIPAALTMASLHAVVRTEAPRAGILALVAANGDANADAMRDALQRAISKHAAGRPQFDDLTVVVGKVS